jgi:hypothetical protein
VSAGLGVDSSVVRSYNSPQLHSPPPPRNITMDTPQLTTRASAALASLTTQLSMLESRQSALLHSMSLTSQTLSHLPAYTAIAPVLSQIPEYTARLARVKRVMAQQQKDVDALKRRALEAGRKRRENLARKREREREEAEKDRGVLRARVVGIDVPSPTPTPVGSAAISRTASPAVAWSPVTASEAEASSASGQGVQGAVRVVKKKKKARKAEIQ